MKKISPDIAKKAYQKFQKEKNKLDFFPELIKEELMDPKIAA